MAGWLFVLPAVIFWLVWFLYPAVKAISISFFRYNYATPETNAFIGMENYIRLFQDPKFFEAMQHSFLMVLVIVPLQTLFAFSIAVLLNGKIRFKGFFRSSCYIPYVISSMAVTIFFMYFFIKDGPATKFFTLFGFENVSWFANVKYALPFLIILYVWQQVGFYVVNLHRRPAGDPGRAVRGGQGRRGRPLAAAHPHYGAAFEKHHLPGFDLWHDQRVPGF